MAWSLFVIMQSRERPQTGQQWLNGAPQQQAGPLARGAHWGHLGAMGVDPRLVVKEGGVLPMARAERPAVACPQSFRQWTPQLLARSSIAKGGDFKVVQGLCGKLRVSFYACYSVGLCILCTAAYQHTFEAAKLQSQSCT